MSARECPFCEDVVVDPMTTNSWMHYFKCARCHARGPLSLIKGAANALLTINAIYRMVDRVNEAGGATSISGIAACNALLSALTKNRARIMSNVVDPLNAAIADYERDR